MNSTRSLAMSGAGIAALILCGCASGPSSREIRNMGQPEVVFLQQPDDLMVSEISPSGTWADDAECLLIVGWAICAAAHDENNWYDRQGFVDKKGLLAAYKDEIAGLGFNDQAYRMYASVIGDTGWLAGKDVHRVQWFRDAAFYTRQSKADSVVYIQPVFALDPYGQRFIVDITVGIQKFDLSRPHYTNNIRKQEFSFSHILSLAPPGASWGEQKQAAHDATFMRSDEALPQWFANDGSQLRAYVAADLREVDRRLRELLGSSLKPVGR